MSVKQKPGLNLDVNETIGLLLSTNRPCSVTFLAG